ncbi:sensor histidine kinase [Nocardioides sp. Kera G14]|uniref:sensor histidine kinase n=1 Tax=Nocardioides sp. Kera G14 TaxID=2884264 RepID=UPI001D0F9B66|nr:HAMP domain-containing sensor histidine kinase [Nocardioides sp. Kera G14]UDY23153.1 HAMP domain-containing histidine kinase [Nocardioides sp. Kera G14]
MPDLLPRLPATPYVTPPATSSWPDELTRMSLKVFVDGLIEFAGFGMAVVSVLREDGALHAAAVGGATPEEEGEIRTLRTPFTTVLDALRGGEQWGRFTFVSGAETEGGEDWGWIPPIDASPDPEAWHPLDVLLALLYDDAGTPIGTLSLDLPLDGRRPGQATRDLLNRYAEQASRAIVAAIERRRHTEQARLAQAARVLVNEATVSAPLEDDFESLSGRLMRLFDLTAVWITIHDRDGGPVTFLNHGRIAPIPHQLVAQRSEETGRMLWELQQTLVVSAEQRAGDVPAEVWERIQGYLDAMGAGSFMAAPIGVGDESLGQITLIRDSRTQLWSEVEQVALQEICRDLGRVLINAHLAQEQQMLARELGELDMLRSTLVRTVAHELKNPLTIIGGNLELLEMGGLEPPEADSAVTRMQAASQRMARIVDDLTTLTQASGEHALSRPNDLGLMVREACYLVNPRGQGLRLRVRTPSAPVLVAGDTGSLDRLVVNLISNAVKYTDTGGLVEVTLRTEADSAEFTVRDTGIGIPAEDQRRLFHEFFRGTNARDRPGTGLGLTIAARIVRRIGGTIEVESEVGVGSTFRVGLPLYTHPDDTHPDGQLDG